MADYNFDPRLIYLVDIDSVELIPHVNGVDLEIDEDHTFTLASGIISHNSAAKSVQGGRGNNPYIGSFPLKGKPLSVRDKDVKQVMENKEIQNILTIIGLKPGVKVTSSPAPDGEWVELEINGKTILANEYDTITIDGKKIKVSTLL